MVPLIRPSAILCQCAPIFRRSNINGIVSRRAPRHHRSRDLGQGSIAARRQHPRQAPQGACHQREFIHRHSFRSCRYALQTNRRQQNGRRYRYYTSQAVLKKIEGSDAPARMPAHDLEQAVVDRILEWIETPTQLLAALHDETTVAPEGFSTASSYRPPRQGKLARAHAFLKLGLERVVTALRNWLLSIECHRALSVRR